MSNQDRTLDQYQELMQLNAATHLIRAARELGVIGELVDGQRTLAQLADSLGLHPPRLAGLAESLVAMGVIEQYGDDYALSAALRLLCQYDADLGDANWRQLKEFVRGDQDSTTSRATHFDSVAATQWIHTPTAMQAAEILDVGGNGEPESQSILDLGCGSGVWSCAIAHRAPGVHVVAIDSPGAIAAARSTAESIELSDRFEAIAGDATLGPHDDCQFDVVLVAQRLSGLGDQDAAEMLAAATRATKPEGGRVVVIDPVRAADTMKLGDCVESLRLQAVEGGRTLRSLEEVKALLSAAGLESPQFTFLPASRLSFGMFVAKKA